MEPWQLTRFPAKNLPEPRLSINLRHEPVRYASGQEPGQIHIDRWYCCRCAQRESDQEFQVVPRKRAKSADDDYHPPSRVGGEGRDGVYGGEHQDDGDASSALIAYRTYVPEKANPGLIHNETIGGVFNECPEPECGHTKCRNCVLGCWSRKSARGRSSIRTVGGLYASPKFVDPLHWECLCGEWECNWFGAHCVFDDDNDNYGPQTSTSPSAQQQSNVVGFLSHQGGPDGLPLPQPAATRRSAIRGTECANPQCVMLAWKGDVGRLTRQSVVMNKYGQRLGTADQKIMVADGPWHLQRHALADPRAALVRNMRPRPFRPHGPPRFFATMVWWEGEPAPDYASRPSPPVTLEERNNPALFVAYETGYLQGVPLEPRAKGKGKGKDLNAGEAEWYEEDGDDESYAMDNDQLSGEDWSPENRDILSNK